MQMSDEAIQDSNIALGSLSLSYYSRQVYMNKQLINLTALEFNLLFLLMKQAPNIVSKRQIAGVIFGGVVAGNEASLFTHISNLRRKLKINDEEMTIQSVRGQGYCLAH